MSLVEFAQSIFKKSAFVVTDDGAIGRKREDEKAHLEKTEECKINKIQPNGETLLTQAILDGNEAECKKLLQNHASPDAKNAHAQTPLIVAVKNLEPAVCKRMVDLLLDAKAFARDADDLGNRPIHYAVQRPDMEEVIVALYNQSGPHCACWVNADKKVPAELAVSKKVAAFFHKMYVRQMRMYEVDNAQMDKFRQEVRDLIKNGSVCPISDAPSEAEPRRITTQDLKVDLPNAGRQRAE